VWRSRVSTVGQAEATGRESGEVGMERKERKNAMKKGKEEKK
jgi:hypothetical protein